MSSSQATRADVLVIGAGQASPPLALKLAAAGKQVVLVERGELGGTCVNDGCTPTKTMIASARAAHVARMAGELGVHTGEVTVDLGAVVDRKAAVVRTRRAWLEKELPKTKGLRLVRGSARFTGPRTVDVDGATFTADLVVVNVGLRPVVPPIAGLDGVPFFDNRGLLELRDLPRHLLVLGGGYIGCELGQMFRRFGSDVTVVDHNSHLLSHEEPEMSTAIEEAFRREGIRLELGAKAEHVAGAAEQITLRLAGGKELRGSHLLVATGRRPNTDTLGCDAAGIKLDERGFIVVDERYATSAEGVYAAGDVTGGPAFTHTSWDDHRPLVDILLGRPARKRSERIVPYAVFTDPQVAGVGLTEREAKKRGIAFEVATMPFGDIARAIETGETAGTMKILADPATHKLLGVHLVGVEVAELLHVFVVAMQGDISLRAIVSGEYVHPTYAEGLQSLVMRLPSFA